MWHWLWRQASDVSVTEIRSAPTAAEGDGGLAVRDALAGFGGQALDPFLLLHELGPLEPGEGGLSLPMHPHRGFCEVPYVKHGTIALRDHWGATAVLGRGELQCGAAGRGMEHGAGEVPAERRSQVVHAFQLWVNVPSARKMDPPSFQDVQAASLPKVRLGAPAGAEAASRGAVCSVLLGSLTGPAPASSPVQLPTDVTYVDVELPKGTAVDLELRPAHAARFVYCYRGAVCAGPVGRAGTIRDGEAARLSAAGTRLRLRAEAGGPVGLPAGVLLLTGAPLREPVFRHGPFVLSSPEDLRRAFEDLQRGDLCAPAAEYAKL
mmetsp:Transcript_321/g.1017  ORF Transcript_321/g.1017 Transcript_321/m.1017 type:complete len:321 (+) Transcript_321:1177-2139(+)